MHKRVPVGVFDTQLSREVDVAEGRTHDTFGLAYLQRAEKCTGGFDQGNQWDAGDTTLKVDEQVWGLCLRQHDPAGKLPHHGDIVVVPRCSGGVDSDDGLVTVAEEVRDVAAGGVF